MIRLRKMPAATSPAALDRGAASAASATASTSIPTSASASAAEPGGASSGRLAAPGGSGAGSPPAVTAARPAAGWRASCIGPGAVLDEVADGEVVARRTEAGDHARADGRTDECLPEALARVHVREMHFDHRHADGRDGVAQGEGRVAVGRRVEHDARRPVRARLVERVDQVALVVVLAEGEGHLRERRAQPALQVAEANEAVDVRLARAEQVEVGAVEDEDAHADGRWGMADGGWPMG